MAPDSTTIRPLAWTSNTEVQGLMWEKRPDGKYFDISKPSVIWVHGWSDSMMPRYYTRFLYKDEFLSLGFNVGIFRYQKDIIDCLKARWQDWEVPTNTDWGVFRRCLNVTEPLSREYVVNAVWKTLGAGNKFRMALNEFFEPVALKGYNEEILLLAHSTGAQVATLGLSDIGARGHFKNDQKFTLVFLDPWFPPKAYVLYPGTCAEWLIPIINKYYSPYNAAKILSYLSNRPNGNFICCLSTAIPGHSTFRVLITHLSWVFDKATFVNDTNRTDLSEGCKYARMYDETYWGSVRLQVGFTEGRIHFHAIDFFCSSRLQAAHMLNEIKESCQNMLEEVSALVHDSETQFKELIQEHVHVLTDTLNSWMTTSSAQQAATIIEFRDKYKTQIDQSRDKVTSVMRELSSDMEDIAQQSISTMKDTLRTAIERSTIGDIGRAAIEKSLDNYLDNLKNILELAKNRLSSIRESFTNATNQLISRIPSPYIANRNSLEVHRMECVWVSRMDSGNRIPCTTLSEVAKLIQSAGYNGCFYCLQRYDSDTLTREQIVNNLTADL